MPYATTSHISVESVCHRVFVFYLVKNRVIKREIVNNLSVAFIQYSRSTKNTNPRFDACCGFKLLGLEWKPNTCQPSNSFFLDKQLCKVDSFYCNIPVKCKQCGYAHSVPFRFFFPNTLPIEVFPLC